MSRINLWIALLLASVLVNGVLLGAGARSWFSPQAPAMQAGGPGPAGGFNMRAFIEALPEARREEARARMLSQRRALRSDARAVGRARAQARRALSAEPFDPAAAAEALEEARAARTVLEGRVEAMVLDLAADLSPEERQAALGAALGPSRLPPRPGGRRRLGAAPEDG